MTFYNAEQFKGNPSRHNNLQHWISVNSFFLNLWFTCSWARYLWQLAPPLQLFLMSPSFSPLPPPTSSVQSGLTSAELWGPLGGSGWSFPPWRWDLMSNWDVWVSLLVPRTRQWKIPMNSRGYQVLTQPQSGQDKINDINTLFLHFNSKFYIWYQNWLLS